jgi:hypothetical protein
MCFVASILESAASNSMPLDSAPSDSGEVSAAASSNLTPERPGHFGLQGMRERAARIAGKLTVLSSAATGTEIKLVVPGGITYRKQTFGHQNLREKIKSSFNLDGSTSDPTDPDR